MIDLPPQKLKPPPHHSRPSRPMQVADLFVGGLALLLGISFAAAAIGNIDWCFRWNNARWIEARWGRTAARLAYTALAIVLLAVSILILLGRE